MAVRMRGLWPACLSSACPSVSSRRTATHPRRRRCCHPMPSSRARRRPLATQPPHLGAPARALRFATLEWPAPGLTLGPESTAGATAVEPPAPLVLGSLTPEETQAEPDVPSRLRPRCHRQQGLSGTGAGYGDEPAGTGRKHARNADESEPDPAFGPTWGSNGRGGAREPGPLPRPPHSTSTCTACWSRTAQARTGRSIAMPA